MSKKSGDKTRAKLGLKKKKDESIRVFVRVRPLFGREIDAGNKSVVVVNQAKASVQITKPDSGEPPKIFTYDATFDHRNTQRDIYDQGAAVIVEGVLGGNATQRHSMRSIRNCTHMTHPGNDMLCGIVDVNS